MSRPPLVIFCHGLPSHRLINRFCSPSSNRKTLGIGPSPGFQLHHEPGNGIFPFSLAVQLPRDLGSRRAVRHTRLKNFLTLHVDEDLCWSRQSPFLPHQPPGTGIDAVGPVPPSFSAPPFSLLFSFSADREPSQLRERSPLLPCFCLPAPCWAPTVFPARFILYSRLLSPLVKTAACTRYGSPGSDFPCTSRWLSRSQKETALLTAPPPRHQNPRASPLTSFSSLTFPSFQVPPRPPSFSLFGPTSLSPWIPTPRLGNSLVELSSRATSDFA